MFKEPFTERASGEVSPKSELETKVEQMMLMRRKKAELEQKRSIPMAPSEGEKLNQEYAEVNSLLSEIENDVNTLKEAERKRLEEKFGSVNSAANDATFQAPLVEGSEDELLNRRLEADERKAA